jgi:hypothetical protein
MQVRNETHGLTAEIRIVVGWALAGIAIVARSLQCGARRIGRCRRGGSSDGSGAALLVLYLRSSAT